MKDKLLFEWAPERETMYNDNSGLNRFEHKYQTEYDFSNPKHIPKIITWHSNIAPKASTSTSQEQGEARVLGTQLV